MTETECQVGIACHNKGVNTPDMAETRPRQIWVSPLRTPSQCNEVCICNERPVGKTKSVPTNTLVVNQISLLGYFRFPRARPPRRLIPSP